MKAFRELSTWKRICGVLIVKFVFAGVCVGGQAASGGASGSVTSVSGRTVNAVDGQPLGRVLVRYGGQAMLTDSQGQFRFAIDAGNGMSLSVTKPGYSVDDEALSGATKSAFTSGTSIDIQMYPEAVLAGTLVSTAGDTLPNIQVTGYRSVYDESGHHWIQGGTGRTNSYGSFRLTVQAGDYRLETSYAGPNGTRKEATLPAVFPEISSPNTSSLLHVRSGETLHLDLQPSVRALGNVKVSFEPERFERNARIVARASNGTAFPLRMNFEERGGEMSLAIPYGSYTLQARNQVQNNFDGSPDAGRQQQGREGIEQADTRVTVSEHDLGGVVLRFAPVSPIPVEMIVETLPTSDNAVPPTLASLNLSLVPLDNDYANADQPAVHVLTRADHTSIFNAAPGVYHLHAQAGGNWFVRAASYGTSDLLRQDLTIAAGSGSLPIRVVVSNQTAGLSGFVRRNGIAIQAQIYLVASTPSASPMVMTRSGIDGSYARATLAPGTYRVIAFEHRHNINFQDSEVVSSLSNEMQVVTLNAGDKATLDLTVTPFTDSH